MINNGSVVDIGGSSMQDNLGKRLRSILEQPYNENNKPTLPDELLYDDIGLSIWNKIIFTPEFYQTHDEIDLLKKYGMYIARQAKPGVTIIDLGAGYGSSSCQSNVLALANVWSMYYRVSLSTDSYMTIVETQEKLSICSLHSKRLKC